jgi:hypothetical protein
VVSLVTGEFAGCGGGFNYSLPRTRERRLLALLAPLDAIKARLLEYLPWILVGVAVLVCLMFVWLYLASVYRFILFDAVLYNRCDLRAGWRRYQRQGASYFLWVISLALAIPATLAVVVGVPILFAWRAGIFRHPREHLALLIGGGLVLASILCAIVLIGALLALFAKDFAIPLMVLEDLGIQAAWRRLFPMLRAEGQSYAIYVLMKIVLAIAGTVLFGLITFVTLLGILIPLAIGGGVLFLIWKLASLTWNVATISVAVALGGAILMGLIYLIAFISAPLMVFFQSYTLHFFSSRYPRLGELMFPALPTPPAPPTPAVETAT